MEFCLWIFLGLLALSLNGARSSNFPSLDVLKPKTSPEVQAAAVQQLISRQVAQRAAEFSVTVDPAINADSDADTFKISTQNGRVLITGSSGVAASMAFYYYAKRYCNCHTSWAGNQFALPKSLPQLQDPVTIKTPDRFRYYQNVCTVSYSFVWWQWERWEQEIDWMAMQGINLPLAFNGQEYIWNKVFLSMGFSEQDIDSFLAGPAFLAWGRMGNIQGWGGPLSASWHAQQRALQHKILERMRALGMIPVLPAFAGFVPRSIKQLYPNVNVSSSSNWGHFPRNYSSNVIVDFQDPFFKNISQSFLKEYIAEFGTNHVYNCDTFNEMTPKSGDPAYLAAASQAVHAGMKAADSDAVWLMQGWLFLSPFWTVERAKALLTAVPQGDMLILDLDSENCPQFQKFESYFGQPFIWCMLHDFGGTVGMYGNIQAVNTGPPLGRKYPNSTMVGVGLTPEGINQNNVVYEFMMENAWRDHATDLISWFSNYPTKRYGQRNDDASQAWQYLLRSVYNATDGDMRHGHSYDVIVKRPSLTGKPDVWYSYKDVVAAQSHLQAAYKQMQAHSELLMYDLVDVTRQGYQVLVGSLYMEMMSAYNNNDTASFQKNLDSLLGTLDDMETVLSLDDHFSLDKWITSATALATNQKEHDLYEYNARNQVTLWGPSANILDYANKQWSGMVKDYYKPRWALFGKYMLSALKTKTKFNKDKFNRDVFKSVEEPFTFAKLKRSDSTLYYKPENKESIFEHASRSFQIFAPLMEKYNNKEDKCVGRVCNHEMKYSYLV